ncbi:MAG: alpha/beta hydrolase [Acidimicrobiaceae bacterium]|nr:alpha/beta hydrolase [Acidimicrobiaceae bacterium]MDE0607636.1 alpha/beta hydrolase [Acidimicrobiaceae bacterium]
MGTITTNDGVRLNYMEKGTGPPIVIVPGWNQTAALYGRQIDAFSKSYRVLALDLRGHGESEAPAHGYRMSRYAMDLRTLITEATDGDAHVLGHSMGCCVLWSYFDLFDGDRIDRAVFVDMATHPVFNPIFTAEQTADYGSIMPADDLFDVVNGLTNGAEGQIIPAMIEQMVTGSISADDKAWLLRENQRMSGPLSAREFFSDIFADWRDVPPRINRPSLYIAGEASFVPMAATKWAAEQTPGARFESIGGDEGGNHFMFIENSELFNRFVLDFLTEPTTETTTIKD